MTGIVIYLRSRIQYTLPKTGNMKNHFHLLQLDLLPASYKIALLTFGSAFVTTLICIPPLIAVIKKYRLYDVPNARKEHTAPVPTMGGAAIVAGMVTALGLWFPFSGNAATLSFFFSLAVLMALGIMDDLKDLQAKYKFLVQTALACLIAVSGIRITSFEGFLGIYELPLYSQYTFTILAITGITNAFNLIDGIDGLAGGLGFMSLLTMGLFLTISGDSNTALIAFALAGGLLGFLYFNLNPARIFMGDTGSLVLGFVIAVLGIRFLQIAHSGGYQPVAHAPVLFTGLVLVPVFDTLRVFITRTWKGGSPFVADKTHIHHLLTNQGFSHGFSSRVICFFHGLLLMEAVWLKNIPQEWALLMLLAAMLLITFILKNFRVFFKYRKETSQKEFL